jgi:spore coat polysaccharide biosynthesis predicted glycosyltransferase SpsG
VFLGGSDPQNLTGMALEALSQSELSHLAVDVVVGANNIYKDSIARQAMHRPLTTLHGSLPHLADLMMQANLAIGAGGATTWERMCLGLPSVVISNAENQRPTSEALARVGLIHYAGHFSDVDTRQLPDRQFRKLCCPVRKGSTLCRWFGHLAARRSAISINLISNQTVSGI